MINRRDFLKNASLFTLGGLMAGKVGSADAAKPVTSETMAAKTVGLQIYSLGKDSRSAQPFSVPPLSFFRCPRFSP